MSTISPANQNLNQQIIVYLIKWESHIRDFSRELGDQAS